MNTTKENTPELPKETVERIEDEGRKFANVREYRGHQIDVDHAYKSGAKSEAIRNLKEKEKLLGRIKQLEEALKKWYEIAIDDEQVFSIYKLAEEFESLLNTKK